MNRIDRPSGAREHIPVNAATAELAEKNSGDFFM